MGGGGRRSGNRVALPGQAVVMSGPRAIVPQARGRWYASTLQLGGSKEYMPQGSGEEKSHLRDSVAPGALPNTFLPRLPSPPVLSGIKRTGAHQSPTRVAQLRPLLAVGHEHAYIPDWCELHGPVTTAALGAWWRVSLLTDKFIVLECPVLLGTPFPPPASWLAGDWGCRTCQTAVVALSP